MRAPPWQADSRRAGSHAPERFDIRRALPGLALIFLLGGAGCRLIDTTNELLPSRLPWLSTLMNPPLEPTQAVELASLQPAMESEHVQAGDLLELTVWDLEEPGHPHTFPVRVSAARAIDVPLLGTVDVVDQDAAAIEERLNALFRERELLLNPRVIVRSTEPATILVEVAGAIERPGTVPICRRQSSVHAAVVAAGGFQSNAGSLVGISRAEPAAKTKDELPGPGLRTRSADLTSAGEAATPSPTGQNSDRSVAETAGQVPDESQPASSALTPSTASRSAPRVRSNSHQPVEVPARETVATPTIRTLEERRGDPGAHSRGDVGNARLSRAQWFDLQRPRELQALRQMRLEPGDLVIVKSAAPPVQVLGAVAQPGSYTLPPGRALHVWQALELAGGIAPEARRAPLYVARVRPPRDGRSGRRWFATLDSSQAQLPESPLVEPGDVIHVAPTTSTRLKKAVGEIIYSR